MIAFKLAKDAILPDLMKKKSFRALSEEEKVNEIALQVQKRFGKPGLEQYKNLFGEIEARDAASRALFSEEQRRMVRPYSSEMIPRDRWIIKE